MAEQASGGQRQERWAGLRQCATSDVTRAVFKGRSPSAISRSKFPETRKMRAKGHASSYSCVACCTAISTPQRSGAGLKVGDSRELKFAAGTWTVPFGTSTLGSLKDWPREVVLILALAWKVQDEDEWVPSLPFRGSFPTARQRLSAVWGLHSADQVKYRAQKWVPIVVSQNVGTCNQSVPTCYLATVC